MSVIQIAQCPKTEIALYKTLLDAASFLKL